MSELIKADDVQIDKPVRVGLALSAAVRLRRVVKTDSRAEPEKKTADDKQDDRADRLGHIRYKAHEIYEQARKQGVADGYASGMEQGAREAQRQAAEAERAAEEEIGKLRQRACEQYSAAKAEAERETLAFAAAVASKILNRTVDARTLDYSELLCSACGANAQKAAEHPAAAVAEESEDTGELAAYMHSEAPAAVAVQAADSEDYPGIEEIMRLNAEDRQKLFGSVDSRDIVLVLRGMNEQLKQAVFEGFPERMRDTLAEEVSLSGPADRRDVEQARERIGRTMARMRRDGEIRSIGREGDGAVVSYL